MSDEVKHKRRIRYSGTHPKTYKEKYKELQPEKYADTVARVMEKGSTPAGMHRSICVEEILDFLQITPGQIGFDATLGYGGHTLEMLKALEGQGHIYAADVDVLELPKTKERLENLGFSEDMLTIKQMNFAKIDELVEESGLFDFILADLGVSSMQIDNPDRGFSFKSDGPLDLRLNPKKGQSAAERLRGMTQEEIEGMLIENADEPNAGPIARAIVTEFHKGNQITTTTELKHVISEALKYIPGSNSNAAIKKTCQRCFQALRIDVNEEFEVLYEFLEKLPFVLKPGGRVAILSFHSGEDRLVKKSFQRFNREGIYSEVTKGPILASNEEVRANGRARSAKLRWAIKA